MPNVPRPELQIAGQKYRPTAADLLAAIEGWEPDPIPPGGWYAEVAGRRYPLKPLCARTFRAMEARTRKPGPGVFGHQHARSFARYMGLRPLKEDGVFVPQGRPPKASRER